MHPWTGPHIGKERKSAYQPILLTGADYYGTLAAARCLGRAGIPIAVADASFSAPARWSRFVGSGHRCPSAYDDAFIDWLMEFGSRSGKHVLAATSDDTAWLFSMHREELSRDFHLYQPPLRTTYGLLNKQLLLEHCQEVGLDTPDTWFPKSHAELEKVANEVRFPVIIKPVTQILNQRGGKGERIASKAALLERYPRFQGCSYPPKLLRFDPSVAQPMVQQFFPEAAENIYSLSGFIDEAGEIYVLRASKKVLQRPRDLGIGVCFEDALIHTELAQRVARLARHVGYFGVFEVEFIRAADRFMLIDFNPRFYSQMAFDIDRGLPLPLFQYYAALRESRALRRLHMAQRKLFRSHDSVFTLKFAMKLLLFAQRVSGVLSPEDARKWQHWLAVHRAHCTDAVFDPADWVPAVLDNARSVARYVRHPRGFIRNIVLNR